MKPLHVAGLCVLAALLTVGAVWLLVEYDVDSRVGARTEQVEYVFFVDDEIGFDVDRDKLRLGAVTPGARSYRDVTFRDDHASFVTARFSGNGSQWLSAQPPRAPFENGTATVTVWLNPGPDAQNGAYAGLATFYIK